MFAVGFASAHDGTNETLDNHTFSDFENLIEMNNGSVEVKETFYSQGEAIKITKDNTTIKGSTLDGKGLSNIVEIYATNVTFESVTFKDGTNYYPYMYGEGGGAIMICEGGNFNIINCTFINNRAREGFAIFAQHQNYISHEIKERNINITDCRFISNQKHIVDEFRYDRGYVIFDEYELSKLYVTNCLFENNYLYDSRGCVQLNSKSRVNNSTFINNTGNDFYKFGIVTFIGADSSVTNSVFISNTYDINLQNDCIIENCTFINSTSSTITLTAYEDDLGEYRYPEDFTIRDCKFINSQDTAISLTYTYYEKYGAVYHSIYERFNITNCYFENCKSRFWGGAIHIMVEYKKSRPSANNAQIIERCVFQNCSSEEGGAIHINYITNKINPVLINNCIFDSDHTMLFELPDGEEHSSLEGCAVHITNGDINNNFWGFNIESAEELILTNQIGSYKEISTPKSWINLDFKVDSLNESNYLYTLYFTNGQNMPNYNVTVKDKNNELICKLELENGTASFTHDKLEDLLIYNNGGNLINRLSSKLALSQSDNQYKNTKINVKLTDSANKPISNQNVELEFSNGKVITVKTDKNGVASYSMPFNVGTYSLVAKSSGTNYALVTKTLSKIKIVKAKIKASAKKLKTTYNSQKTFTVKLNKAISDIKIKLKVYTNKKSKTYTIKTNKKGIATFKASTLKIGKHKVEITSGDGNCDIAKITSQITINKAKTIVNVAKKSNKLKITIKNKATKKAVSKIKIKVKIKSKSYTIKTNAKGIASLNTKNIAKGSCKVIISSANSNYIINKKTTIKI